jgi:hypothetical protein
MSEEDQAPRLTFTAQDLINARKATANLLSQIRLQQKYQTMSPEELNKLPNIDELDRQWQDALANSINDTERQYSQLEKKLAEQQQQARAQSESFTSQRKRRREEPVAAASPSTSPQTRTEQQLQNWCAETESPKSREAVQNLREWYFAERPPVSKKQACLAIAQQRGWREPPVDVADLSTELVDPVSFQPLLAPIFGEDDAEAAFHFNWDTLQTLQKKSGGLNPSTRARMKSWVADPELRQATKRAMVEEGYDFNDPDYVRLLSTELPLTVQESNRPPAPSPSFEPMDVSGLQQGRFPSSSSSSSSSRARSQSRQYRNIYPSPYQPSTFGFPPPSASLFGQMSSLPGFNPRFG